MNDILTIKRNWNEAIIRIAIDDKEIKIETSIDSFERQLEDEIVSRITGFFLTKEKIRKLFKETFIKVVREMKEESIKMIYSKQGNNNKNKNE